MSNNNCDCRFENSYNSNYDKNEKKYCDTCNCSGHKDDNCCRGPRGPMGPKGEKGEKGDRGYQGPYGPTGAAGASILDSYDSYQDFITAHPSGTIGDAYLVDGVLYVWGGDPASWQNMGSLIGPTGAAGASILDSYDTYQDFIAAHPSGTIGDAYLVDGVLYVWGGDPASWQNMGSLIGPTGPTGAAGASILGSYDTYRDFITAHPSGTIGDAYLVDGQLYVWGGDPASWQNMGSLIGPTGAAGASILDSYDSYQDFITAHPSGNIGDAYLVDGVLYVWGGDPASWQDMGSLIGPVGPTGAAGASILGSYDSYQDLITAHPSGTTGDAYLAGGVLYVWGGDPASWQDMGSLIGPVGPTGPTGAAGASILGSYDTYQDLITAHPSGTTGDAYLAGGVLYVWGGDPASWQNMGSLIGPTGAAGASILDSYDSYQDFITAHPSGTIGDAYLVDGQLYVWGGDPASWQNMGSLIGPTGPAGSAASSVAIIPFASQQAPHVGTNNSGEAVNAAPIGFGYMEYSTLAETNVALDIDVNDKSFNISADVNRQVAFSLPFDMILNSLYITVGNWDAFFLPPTGTLVYPYVQIYAAPAGSNTFLPIPGAVAKPEQGIDPASAVAATMRAASVDGLNIILRAGTRIAICGMMEITGDTEARNYYLYFTGGVGLTRWVE